MQSEVPFPGQVLIVFPQILFILDVYRIMVIFYHKKKLEWEIFSQTSLEACNLLTNGRAQVLEGNTDHVMEEACGPPPLLMATTYFNTCLMSFSRSSKIGLLEDCFLAVDCVMASAWQIIQDFFRSAYPSWRFLLGACIRTGPVFVAMFKPLGIVIAAAVSIICLSDTLYLGSLVGATVNVIGFYSVMWGKAKEEKVGVDDG
ncbi:hypothetical protein NC651_020753 [Populus alba x Populus x berolinensis]|nr:hypothetical protein NC651_020753 [Populus alba x Populus x berolinensis]